jgi:MFS family permease
MPMLWKPMRSMPEATRDYRWGTVLPVIGLCLLAWTFSSFDQSLFGYAIPGIMAEFEVGLPTISLIMATGFVAAAPAALALGVMADRMGRRKTLAFCVGVSSLLVGLHALATNLETLAVLRVLGFAISAGVSPIVTTYAAETAPARWRGVIIGGLQCGFPLGWFFASLSTAPLIEAYGWRAPFFVAFAVVPLSLIFLKLLPESQLFKAATGAEKPVFRDNVAALMQAPYRRRIILITLIYFFFGASYAGSAYYFPTFLNELRGYTPADAARSVGLGYGIGLIGYFASSFTGEFLLTRRVTLILWTWIGTAAFAGFVWLPQTPTENILWFSGLAMFGYGSMPLIQTIKSEMFPTRLRATAAAITAGVGLNIGYAGAPVLVAQVVETMGWQMAFSLTVVPAMFACGFLALFLDTVASGAALD